MALQIQMNQMSDDGTPNPMYPINRSTDIIVGSFLASAEASLPGTSEGETLDKSLSLIKAYLTKLKSSAYVDVAKTLENSVDTVPNSKLLYATNTLAAAALPKTGGDIGGFINFTNTYNSSNEYTTGLKFKVSAGTTDAMLEKTYQLKGMRWTPGGGTILGAIGSNTIVPLDSSSENLGDASRKWNFLYASNINGFTVHGDIVPNLGSVHCLGDLDHLFDTAYLSSIKLKHPGYTEMTLSTNYEQYGRYSFRTCLNVNSSIIPSEDVCYLGNTEKSWFGIYVNYIQNLQSMIFSSTTDNTDMSVRYIPKYDTDGTTLKNCMEVDGNIIPSSNSKYTIGQFDLRYDYVYANICYANSLWYIGEGDSTNGTVGKYNEPYGYVYTNAIVLQSTNKTSYQFGRLYYGGNGASVYTSGGVRDTTTDAIYISSKNNNLRIGANYLEFATEHTPSTAFAFQVISDPKVKKFTDDILRDDISTLFDYIDIDSYVYRYGDDEKITIGVNAEKLNDAIVKSGLGDKNLNVVKCDYDYFLSRGDDEDDKYYKRFFNVSYTDLHNMAIIKLQSVAGDVQKLKEEISCLHATLESITQEFQQEVSEIKSKLG